MSFFWLRMQSRIACYIELWYVLLWGFPDGSAVKNPPAMQETQKMWVPVLGQEDPLESDTATCSSILFFFFFIFKIYKIVLVLPNIKMNPPQGNLEGYSPRGHKESAN